MVNFPLLAARNKNYSLKIPCPLAAGKFIREKE
jgi:hypothetical protein